MSDDAFVIDVVEDTFEGIRARMVELEPVCDECGEPVYLAYVAGDPFDVDKWLALGSSHEPEELICNTVEDDEGQLACERLTILYGVRWAPILTRPVYVANRQLSCALATPGTVLLAAPANLRKLRGAIHAWDPAAVNALVRIMDAHA